LIFPVLTKIWGAKVTFAKSWGLEAKKEKPDFCDPRVKQSNWIQHQINQTGQNACFALTRHATRYLLLLEVFKLKQGKVAS